MAAVLPPLLTTPQAQATPALAVAVCRWMVTMYARVVAQTQAGAGKGEKEEEEEAVGCFRVFLGSLKSRGSALPTCARANAC